MNTYLNGTIPPLFVSTDLGVILYDRAIEISDEIYKRIRKETLYS